MTDADAGLFVARLAVLAEIFSSPLSATAQAVYFEALRDLPLAAVEQALTICLQTCRFMPRPADLRHAIAGDPDTAIEAAWLEYKRLARAIGGYASAPIADAVLAETILATFGSWEAACWTDRTPEMWTATRKEFGRIYRVMAARGETGPRTLVGYCERVNVEAGYLAPPSRLEGDAPSRRVLPAGTLTVLTREQDDDTRRRAERRDAIQRGLAAAIDRRDARARATEGAPDEQS